MKSSIERMGRLTLPDRESMFTLFSRYFDNTTLPTFMKDMAEKDWVIVLRNPAGRIVGFSTMQVIRLPMDGQEHLFLFSGDTIVDKAHWQDSTLAGCFGHFMLRLIRDNPGTPLHWFLISKGFRTYRFLPVYFRQFHPAHDHPTPEHEARLIQAIARFKFNGAYDPVSGLVRFNGSRDRLKPEMSHIPDSRRIDPHVAFFLARNPSSHLGDELACLAEISETNLNPYAWRAIRHATVTWKE